MTDSVTDSVTNDQAYDHLLGEWREQYAEKLAGPYGWWSITTLTWLEQGANVLGSGQGARIPLAARLPEQAVRFDLGGGEVKDNGVKGTGVRGAEVTITPLVEGVLIDGQAATGPIVTHEPVTLQLDADPQPVVAKLIFRGELIGVRVYDPAAAAARDRDAEIAWFPNDLRWSVDAEFLAAEEGETIAVADVTGQVKDVPVSGRARFEHDGASYTLVATPAGTPGRLFFNFRDASNGMPGGTPGETHSGTPSGTHSGTSAETSTNGTAATYGGGRFLNVDGPVDGRILLDFNRAHHPPCAHSPYATCPMPTEENRLPFAVRAGERHVG